MLSNFAIGLREGLEAALVIGILVAYLKKQNRQADVKRVALGVFAAILVSLLAGLTLTFLASDAQDGANELIAGFASLLAVVFVTWMIFWMAKHSRSLPSEMHNKLEKNTSALAVAGIAFFAVVREGVETSVFLWSATSAAGQGWVSKTSPMTSLVSFLRTQRSTCSCEAQSASGRPLPTYRAWFGLSICYPLQQFIGYVLSQKRNRLP